VIFPTATIFFNSTQDPKHPGDLDGSAALIKLRFMTQAGLPPLIAPLELSWPGMFTKASSEFVGGRLRVPAAQAVGATCNYTGKWSTAAYFANQLRCRPDPISAMRKLGKDDQARLQSRCTHTCMQQGNGKLTIKLAAARKQSTSSCNLSCHDGADLSRRDLLSCQSGSDRGYLHACLPRALSCSGRLLARISLP